MPCKFYPDFIPSYGYMVSGFRNRSWKAWKLGGWQAIFCLLLSDTRNLNTEAPPLAKKTASDRALMKLH
jgi:hypothetical protein